MNYIIAEISGRQYFVEPNKIIEVEGVLKTGQGKTLEVDKVLLNVDDGKIEIGKPYLKKELRFEVLETVKKEKIRVATYKAKANYRRVKGQKREATKIIWKIDQGVKKD